MILWFRIRIEGDIRHTTIHLELLSIRLFRLLALPGRWMEKPFFCATPASGLHSVVLSAFSKDFALVRRPGVRW